MSGGGNKTNRERQCTGPASSPPPEDAGPIYLSRQGFGAYVYRRHEVLSVAKDLVGAQPLAASIQGSSFKVTMTSEFSDENNEKGETGESDASVL